MLSLCFCKNDHTNSPALLPEQERSYVEEKKALRKKIGIAVAAYACIILAILAIANTHQINRWLLDIVRILRPILIGLAVAYLCNPLFRFLEQKVFSRLHSLKMRRSVSLLCTFVLFFLLIVLLLLIMLPQLIESIIAFSGNYDGYLTSAVDLINRWIEQINRLAARFLKWDSLLRPIDADSLPSLVGFLLGSNGILTKMGAEFGSVVDMLGQTVSAITDSILGLFVAIYLLGSKEKRAAQVMKARRALFGDRLNQSISRFLATAHNFFGKFIVGRLLGAFLVFLLTYLSTSIFGIRYALLISAFLGIANILPIVGIIIGAVPTAVILLLSQPEKILIYLLIVILVQQLDSNIITPKILGRNTGISSLCVLIAIVTMGKIWGLLGMFLGVPLFAAILELTELHVIDRLQKKGIPSGLANHYASDTVVDPSKDAITEANRLLRKIEYEYLRTERCIQSDITAPLTKKQTICYRLYRFGMRMHLINAPSEETLVQCAVEETVKQAEIESDAAFRRYSEQRSVQGGSGSDPAAPSCATVDATVPVCETASAEESANVPLQDTGSDHTES